jgi:hypothetical protein
MGSCASVCSIPQDKCERCGARIIRNTNQLRVCTACVPPPAAAAIYHAVARLYHRPAGSP